MSSHEIIAAIGILFSIAFNIYNYLIARNTRRSVLQGTIYQNWSQLNKTVIDYPEFQRFVIDQKSLDALDQKLANKEESERADILKELSFLVLFLDNLEYIYLNEPKIGTEDSPSLNYVKRTLSNKLIQERWLEYNLKTLYKKEFISFFEDIISNSKR